MTTTVNFFDIKAFSESNQPYDCNVWIAYKNKAYKSIKPNNSRHPHDSEYWYEVGDMSGLLDHLISDHKAVDLTLPYYPECSNGCVAMFDKGQCVVDRVLRLDTDGNPIVDDCGEKVYDLLIFTSLVDCNTDEPLIGSTKSEPTWDGGYTTCGYLNRPVAYTQDGNTEDNWLHPDAPQNLKCVLDCSSPDDETIALATLGNEGTYSQTIGNKLRVKHDNKSIVTTPQKGLEVAVIGQDKAGNPVDVRNNPCFVTCETMGNGLTWDETTKKWIVNLARGLTFTATGAVEAFLDTLAGLKFNGNKIAVAIKNGLNFNSSGEIEVKPANNSIIVDGNGVKVNIANGLELNANGINVNLGSGTTFEPDGSLSVKPANNSIIVDSSGVKVGQIGVDRNGQPVMAGACLVTCATDLYVTGIDDTGVNTVITLSDGTTISGPEIDKDDYVVNFVQSGGILTITMKSGATYSVTLPATQDNYLTNLTIDGNGLITATRNNGLPDLTVQIPKPETLKFPMATYRGGFGTPTTNPVFTGNGKLYFSEWINQSGFFPETLGITDIPIPRSGWYRIDHRCTARWTGGSPPTGRCSVFKNGTTVNGLGINLGTNYFPFMTKNAQEEIPKAVHAYFNAGDLISVETTNMGAGAEIIGETLMIQFVSF